MFKLVKILNSGANVPEPVTAYFNGEIDIVAGCIYFTNIGGITTHRENEYSGLIYALQNAPLEEMSYPVLCYFITSDMIFEADMDETCGYLSIGDHFKLVRGSLNEPYAINNDVDLNTIPDGTVVDTTNHQKTRKALVRFNV